MHCCVICLALSVALLFICMYFMYYGICRTSHDQTRNLGYLLPLASVVPNSEPSALDMACEKIEAQQQAIEELQKRLEEVTLKQSFGLERFTSSDDDIRFYTRFASYRHLQAFWRMIEPATRRIVCVGTRTSTSNTAGAPDKSADPPRRPSRCLPLIDKLFLFLVYLSLGLKEKDLGDQFNIHQSTVSRIIKTWVNFLYTLLGAVGIWMSPEDIRATMSSVFGKYSDTQVIVDCTELKCQTPSSLLLQSEMFSQYKSHTTLKGMIGVSPIGRVTLYYGFFRTGVSKLGPGGLVSCRIQLQPLSSTPETANLSVLETFRQVC